MSLTAGTRVGAFEIVGSLGAGGMGEVYRARDTRLGRDVALKVLPATFRHDPERLTRFQREAQLLAALNHPHIGAIYGLEDAGSSQVLVLELIEGETLAVRLSKGPLAIGEAMRIAREIVDALEAAHEKGIIHRDLKPSNIALTQDGHVKVLDFGLAKAMDPAALGSDAGHAGVTQSPTFTMGATQAGVILGTAAYMSPEQAKGRAADKRSDVWAFGCVLFEMLSGTRAFEGEDVSDTMAAVLRGEPTWDALPASVPQGVRTLLRKCLDKDRRTRVPDVSVVRYMLDEAAAAPAVGATAPPPAPGRRVPWLPWAVAGGALLAAAAVLIAWAPWRPPPAVAPVRLHAELGADVEVGATMGAAYALSPDGRTLAFVAAPVGQGELTDQALLHVRRLDQLQATAIAGTDGAAGPFFSPDGQWLAFFAGAKLKKVSVNGGGVVTLADAPTARGGTWTADDVIVFAPASTGPLSRVSAAGGAVSVLMPLAEGETMHRWPEALPGGRILYTRGTTPGFAAENAELAIRDPDGTARVIVPGAFHGRYAASGHIIYVTNATVFAAAFDAERGELTGAGVPILEAVAFSTANGTAHFAVSPSGTAVYLPGESITTDAPIAWLDASGNFEPLRAARSSWSSPEFAPDGTRLALDMVENGQEDIWVLDLPRDTMSRLTFDAADDHRPIWSPDGRRMVFSSRRGNKKSFNLFWQSADGTGEAQRLTDSESDQTASSVHPSGRFVAYDEVGRDTRRDIWIVPLEGDEASGWKPGQPRAFLKTPQTEGSPMFSPDGRWIAYISDETGRNEIYVRPFPGPGGKWQISNGLADDPTWSPDGRQLFYLSVNEGRVMVVPYAVDGESFRAGRPREWSTARVSTRPRAPSRDWALHPDGRRFAVAPLPEPAEGESNRLVFVFNFFEELRRVARPTQ